MKVFYRLIALKVVLTMSSAYAEPRNLVISGIEGSINSEISEMVLSKAYEKIDINLNFMPLPGQRSLVTSNSGESDGELFRINGIEKKFTNLIKVPTSINELHGIAYSKKPILVNGWQSLSKFKIGIQRGIKFAERGTAGMNPIVVEENDQLFKMLDGGRIEIVVMAQVNALKTISRLPKVRIVQNKPSIQVYKLYHYLHKKNEPLVARLNKVLETMSQSGEIKKIRENYLKKRFNL